MQQYVLQAIHEGHQGRDKCRLRAKGSLYWNGTNKQIEEMAAECPACFQKQKKIKFTYRYMVDGYFYSQIWHYMYLIPFTVSITILITFYSKLHIGSIASYNLLMLLGTLQNIFGDAFGCVMFLCSVALL